MRQSQLFTKTRKEAPADEVSKNAQLLIKGGFIHKEMAGVYSLLPLGFKVINKIKKIVAREMEKLGSQEIIMSTLQARDIWEKTDRWSDEKVDIWFKTELKNGNQIGLGWSHEEPITNMIKDHINSYKDLPVFVHQFQNKLRNESRAKSGVMRCREFIMKDMYSYAISEEQHMDFYDKTIDAYMEVYKKLGLGDITYVTSASGGVFTDKFSHEFQTLCEVGEDIIYVHKEKSVAVNEEIFNEESLNKLGYKAEDFEMKKAAEVGNIFTFGTKKCEEMELFFMDREGKKQPVFLGSYGIGITRLMGVITEIFADDKGMIWPESIAPFKVHLIQLGSVADQATALYEKLIKQGIEVLLDDRDMGAGAKFADADLIGIPYRVLISDKSLEKGGLEFKKRNDTEAKIITESELLTILSK
ncbi:MAG: aminoacyl--tRNA ligase-related protein [bacterium]